MPPRKRTAPVPHTGAAAAANAASSPSLPFAPGVPARPFTDSHAVPLNATKEPPAATLADVAVAYAKPAVQSASNALGDPTQNLQKFTLDDLAVYTKEKSYSTNASRDVHLFYVGRDDVHDILKYILSRVTISLYLNMFGFDDSELNNIIMQKVLNPAVTVMITLDKSQSNGVHEKALVAADEKYNLAAFNTHFAIGESLTHQISHTKGFVADGRVAAEGSTNWSSSGEGTFVVQGMAGGPGYKAQNNTQSVITDPDTIVRFQTELITEHMTVSSVAHSGAPGYKVSQPLSQKLTPATQAVEDHVRALTTSAPRAPVANSVGRKVKRGDLSQIRRLQRRRLSQPESVHPPRK
jgi:hypothetical protein